MPTLQTPRREKYAQELASGKSATEAYERAGYAKNSGNCIRLKANESVATRLAELQHGGAERAVVTVASLVADLEDDRQLARALGQLGPAVSASMGKARILGLIIDRREVGEAGAFDHMTDEELMAEATRLSRELGLSGPRLLEGGNKKPL